MSMNAGPEMDIDVARRVMGAHPAKISPEGVWIEFPESPGMVRLPRYSTEIGDAWDVVRHMRRFIFSARTLFAYELQVAISNRKFPRKADGIPILIHLSEVPLLVEPEDICRAALAVAAAGHKPIIWDAANALASMRTDSP